MTVERVRPAIPASIGPRQVMTADSLERSLSDIDLDAILEGISGKIDPSKVTAFAKEQARDREQIAALAVRFAESEVYRPLFEWFLDITLRRPIAPAGMSAEQTLDYVRRREGENAVAWQLLAAVAEGRSETPDRRD